MNFEDARDARKPIRYLCVASAGITILALALDAGAASPAAATRPSVAKDDVLEEVVVTAEKRAGTVQTTPFSISAIGALELESRGVTNVEDAVREVPGISMRSGGPDQTEFEMRGLSSTGGASPTVGFYVDDAPLTPPVLALNGKVVVDPDLFDLNRIEVLRGPQGSCREKKETCETHGSSFARQANPAVFRSVISKHQNAGLRGLQWRSSALAPLRSSR